MEFKELVETVSDLNNMLDSLTIIEKHYPEGTPHHFHAKKAKEALEEAERSLNILNGLLAEHQRRIDVGRDY